MNTQTIPGLAKTLLALSVFFASVSVIIIAIPVSYFLGVHTVQGVHGPGLFDSVPSALWFVLIGTVLFGCFILSCQKRGRLATGLLWSAALAGGVYAAMLMFGMLHRMI
jgi:hypothetical protein